MPDVDVADLQLQKVHTTPYGNLYRHVGKLVLASATAADVYYISPLAQGMEIFEVRTVVHDPAGSGDELDIGHHQRGAGSWTDDPDYFFENQDINAATNAGSLSNTQHGSLVIDQPNVYFTATIVNAISAGFDISFYIDYTYKGNL